MSVASYWRCATFLSFVRRKYGFCFFLLLFRFRRVKLDGVVIISYELFGLFDVKKKTRFVQRDEC